MNDSGSSRGTHPACIFLSPLVPLEIVAPGRVILRRAVAGVGVQGKAAKSGILSGLLSLAMGHAAKSLVFAEATREEASTYDILDPAIFAGVVTCSAEATRLPDGDASVTAVAVADRRVCARASALFRYRADRGTRG